MSNPTTDSTARAFVLEHLGAIIREFPVTIQPSLEEKFIADFTTPRTPELELVLRKRMTDDETRYLLFAPRPEQYRHYAPLLALGRHWPVGTWQAELHKRFLTLFYFKHARNWPLVVEFVLQDGLRVLVDCFLHEDLQVRGQAIDSFVQITSHPSFDWFEEPRGYEARALHAAMVALAAPEVGFLRQLITNIRLYEDQGDEDEQLQSIATKAREAASSAVRLPGGTYVMLQIVAFFLSWVRKCYTQNELRLSRELLTLLRDWPARTKTDNPEELELAKNVYEDFSRWPAIEDTHEQDPRAVELDDTGSSKRDLAIPDGNLMSANDVYSSARIDALLAQDNEGAVDEAITLCTMAIDANVQVVDAHLSRAKAHTRRMELARSCKPAATGDDLRQCLSDCSTVERLDAGNLEALRCQLRALELTGLWSEGVEILGAWLMKAENRLGGSNSQRMPYRIWLDEDVAFFRRERERFQEKVVEASTRREAEARHYAEREAKEAQIAARLLQQARPQHQPIENPTTVCRRNEKKKCELQPPTTDLLSRFRASSLRDQSATRKKPQSASAKTQPPLGRARALARKISLCVGDAEKMQNLIFTAETCDVVAAMESILPEKALAPVLAALIENLESMAACEDTRVTLLGEILKLGRLRLFAEMASVTAQREIHDLLDRGRKLLLRLEPGESRAPTAA